jgi:NAD(P)-dependent dehydrogenase (short-subunit alcohol dehydrogenase family)
VDEQQLPADFSPPANHLKDRVIFITGAAGGIGSELSRCCANHGATVIMAGKKIPALENIYDEICGQGGQEPVIYPVDLAGASPDDYASMADTIKDQFNGLDAVVHNAADFDGLRPLDQIDPNDWMQSIQVNLNAPFLINQALAPLLAQSGQPRILFTLDDQDMLSRAYWGAYGVAKAGLGNLAAITAQELESGGVEVNCIRPGPTQTKLRAKLYMGKDPAALTGPADLMSAYLFLLGGQRAFVTGKVMSA